MFPRHIQPVVIEALRRSPVVLLNGARQVGKSTLARALVDAGIMSRYYSLDNLATLDAARRDPEGFVAASAEPTVVDEAQLEPRLFRAVKAAVDRDRRPGRFLLTGSADLMVLPQAADALVGRMEVRTLGPLSQGEMNGAPDGFLDMLLAEEASWPDGGRAGRGANGGRFDRDTLASAICQGGFPEPVQRPEGPDRAAWYESYVTTVIMRDIRERADVEHLSAMPRLVAMLAARAMTLLNLAEVSRSIGLPAATVRRYFALLEASMLVRLVPAFAGDLARRVVKSPKPAMVDTGLAAGVLGLDADRLAADPVQMGRLAENFAFNEVERQAGWSGVRPRLMHARTAAGREVDIVVEAPDGRVAGIEVKAARTVGSRDLAGLVALREAVGDRFVRGVVLHTGDTAVPFAPDLWAVPFDALWRTPAPPG